VLAAAVMVVLWLGVRTLAQGDSPLIDEEQHQRVIHDFLTGRWALPADLPMPPAFHVLVAGFEWLLGPSLLVGRLWSVCMALVGFAAFGSLSRRLRGGRWPDGFRVYAYQPLLFPLTAMIYTDQTAVTFLVLALLAHVSGRFGWAVALAAASLVRQTHLVWIAVLVAWTVSRPREGTPPGARHPSLRAAVRAAVPLWGYGVVLLVALVLATMAGRLTAGTPALWQPAFNVDQYYVLFLCVLVLWAPIFVDRARDDLRALVRWSAGRPAIAAGVALVLAGVIAVLLDSYSNPHPWNQIGGLVRNWPLRLADRFPWVRLLLLLASAWAVYQTVRFTLERRGRTVLAAAWGAGLLSLSVMRLVEPRYYIPLLVLVDLFNDYEPRHAAWLARWYRCVAAAACALSLTGRFW
jgi:hypothetical protein